MHGPVNVKLSKTFQRRAYLKVRSEFLKFYWLHMFLHPRCAFVFNLGIMKAYLESSTTNIYYLNRKNVLHYITINTTCFGFT